MSILKAGFLFRDETGKLIATLVSDLSPGDEITADKFLMADESKPTAGDPIHRSIVREIMAATPWYRGAEQ